mgnify:CR=1 FL=1
MKYKLLVLLVLFASNLIAQPPGGMGPPIWPPPGMGDPPWPPVFGPCPNNTCIPADTGIIYLIGVGLIFGLMLIFKRRKKDFYL